MICLCCELSFLNAAVCSAAAARPCAFVIHLRLRFNQKEAETPVWFPLNSFLAGEAQPFTTGRLT